MRFIVKASTSGAPELGCDSAANFSGDRHSGVGGPRLEGAVAGRLCRGVSLELRRWLRVGFTGVAVDSRASAFDGDSASWIAAICSALPTPGKGWSQTWSARRRDAPVDVERCESPDALRALLVEAADWGRCRGMVGLRVGATASGAGCPSARGARLPSAVCRPAPFFLVTLQLGEPPLRQSVVSGSPELFFAPLSASVASGAARRCLCRRPVPVLRAFRGGASRVIPTLGSDLRLVHPPCILRDPV